MRIEVIENTPIATDMFLEMGHDTTRLPQRSLDFFEKGSNLDLLVVSLPAGGCAVESGKLSEIRKLAGEDLPIVAYAMMFGQSHKEQARADNVILVNPGHMNERDWHNTTIDALALVSSH